jgi:hypothetical protein
VVEFGKPHGNREPMCSLDNFQRHGEHRFASAALSVGAFTTNDEISVCLLSGGSAIVHKLSRAAIYSVFDGDEPSP